MSSDPKGLRSSFAEIYSRPEKILSFEFFPPRQESALHQTFALIGALKKSRPHFMTVTYGAGGGTRAQTQRMTSYIHNILGVPAVAHLTCIGHTIAEVDEILNGLQRKGINKILALRGDPPRGAPPAPSAFSDARQLVRHIKRRTGFSVAVAGYPETHRQAQSPQADIDYLKAKVDAGAELIITQLFFDAEIYFKFVDRARAAGIGVPITPGVMPISCAAQLKKFTEMCGASIPPGVMTEINRLNGDTAAIVEFGTDFAINLCSRLLTGGAPGIHLYTLNRSEQVLPIIQALGLDRSQTAA